MNQNNSPNLDYLRSFAVGLVFADHLWLSAIGPSSVAEYIGRMGVILFFFHTSFVLMQSMARGAKAGPAFGSFAASFYVRRAFRIYPLAIVFVLACVALKLPGNAWDQSVYVPFSLKQVVSNLLLIQNLTKAPPVSSPMWSLPFEVEMYLMLPVIFALTRKSIWGRFAGLYLAAGLMAAGVLKLTGHLDLFAFVPCFLAGCLAFRMTRFSFQLPPWMWPVGLAGLVGGTSLLHSLTVNPKIAIPVEWSMCLTLGLLFRSCREMPPGRLTASTEWIARYSYGIYLSHVPWMCAIFLWTGWPVPVKAAVVLMATLATSIASFYLIEDPLIGWGRRVADWRRPATLAKESAPSILRFTPPQVRKPEQDPLIQ